jgi:hypothetical protein
MKRDFKYWALYVDDLQTCLNCPLSKCTGGEALPCPIWARKLAQRRVWLKNQKITIGLAQGELK